MVAPAVVVLCLVATGFAAWQVDVGRGQVWPWLYHKFNWWSFSVLSNFLGILAQVIGLILTITLTGVFMVGQYLSERVPEQVVRPLLRGATVVAPLVALLSALLYDVWLFYITSDYFTPVIGASVVVVVVALVVPSCLFIVSRSVGALNVHGVITGLGDAVQEAVEKRNPKLLAAALEHLDATVRHAVERGHSDIAALAFRTLMRSVKNWSQKLHNAFEVLAGTGGKQHVEQAEAVLTDGQAEILTSVVQNGNAVLFGAFVREIALAFPLLEPSVRSKLKKTFEDLVKSEQSRWGPEFDVTLLSAAHTIAVHGVTKLDFDSFHFGTNMLQWLWDSSPRTLAVTRTTVLRTATHLDAVLQSSVQERSVRQGYETRLHHLLVSWGQELVIGEDELAQQAWLDSLIEQLQLRLKSGHEEAVEQLFDRAVKVYGVALINRCSTFLKAFPDSLRFVFGESDAHYKIAARLILKLARSVGPAISFGGQEPLSYMFIWLRSRAVEKNDEETILEILPIMARFLTDESKTTYAFGFWARIPADADRVNSKKIIKTALRTLMAQITTKSVRSPTHQVEILRQIGHLLTSKHAEGDDHKEFLQFCRRVLPTFESVPQSACLAQLDQLTHRLKDPTMLKEAAQVYERTGLKAIEQGDETLARLVSNSVGWSAHRIIVADDMALPKKEEALRVLLGAVRKMSTYARIFELSRPTRVFLATLFIVLGAVCEEAKVQEKAALLELAVEATTLAVTDLSILRDALEARIVDPVEVEQLKGKGEAPYSTFVNLVLKRMTSGQAAAAAQ